MPQIKLTTLQKTSQKGVDAYNRLTPEQKLAAMKGKRTRKLQVVGSGGQITTMTGLEGYAKDPSKKAKGLTQAQADNKLRLTAANVTQAQNANEFEAMRSKRYR